MINKKLDIKKHISKALIVLTVLFSITMGYTKKAYADYYSACSSNATFLTLKASRGTINVLKSSRI